MTTNRRRREEEAATALAIRETEAALEQSEAEKAALRTELADLRANWEALIDFLVGAGVLRPEADPLTVSDADLIYNVEPPVADVPNVPTLTQAQLLGALEHAANRKDAYADRPFSRRYMVGEGPLTRTQFEALRAALVQSGYLLEPERPRAGYPLTDKGASLLQDVKNGRYPIE